MPGHRVDLHLHTTTSDGKLTPEQLVDLLGATQLEYVSITDHDTTSGLDRVYAAAKKYPRLKVIPGIEISADYESSEVHVLAYFIDYKNEAFQKELAKIRDGRIGRAQKMLTKLEEMGMPLDWERVRDIAKGDSVGRPHIAQALIERKYVATNQEAFDKYLKRGGPAYVETEKFLPVQAVRFARSVGGLPVIAHPNYIKPGHLDAMLPELKAEGLAGIDVFYSGFDNEKENLYKRYADKYNLVPCGGSDYHGFGHEGEYRPGDWGPPMSTVERLIALAKPENVRMA